MLHKLSLPKADVIFYPNLFSQQESNLLFEKLYREIQWEQGQIKLFGKIIDEPRQSAFYGDNCLIYTYSGKKQQAKIWTQTLLYIKEKIEDFLLIGFNSILANLYRNGKDSMGWHSDNEKELGLNPIIASLSFGATRCFQLKHIGKPSLTHTLELTSGSLLLMQGTTQHYYKHQVPKTNKVDHPRINLTFRNIL
ncbi:MAG: alpha-ketoglutarate-dependent dioxygenase AlkB [Acidobacteria bacterium]|nr:alpha-ketoglutarate-dependent dioxygenase AlkB [Acidobacteriota bacterium]